MKKKEFLDKLKNSLNGLPKEDIEERLAFYSEMIDDRIEEGLSEEDAVKDIGSVDEIVSQIIIDTPFSKIVKEKVKRKRKLSGLEIALIIIGSPIWVSLLVSLFAVVVSLYAVVFSVGVSLWAVFLSCAVSAPCLSLVGVIYAISGNALSGLFLLGCGIALVGLSIIFYFIDKCYTKISAKFPKAFIIGIKKLFIKKEKSDE